MVGWDVQAGLNGVQTQPKCWGCLQETVPDDELGLSLRASPAFRTRRALEALLEVDQELRERLGPGIGVELADPASTFMVGSSRTVRGAQRVERHRFRRCHRGASIEASRSSTAEAPARATAGIRSAFRTIGCSDRPTARSPRGEHRPGKGDQDAPGRCPSMDDPRRRCTGPR